MRSVLRADLSTGGLTREDVDPGVSRAYLGGKGLGAYYLYRRQAAGTDPLSPVAAIWFIAGPLTGTDMPCGNRYSLCCRSPLTGAWLDSSASGFWGVELRLAGWDAIALTGRAPSPVYLLVEGTDVSLLDASQVWGMNTHDASRWLKDKHRRRGIEPRVVCIGPAGERGALLANVIAEGRALGRGGSGAVLGSKNLKAIVVAAAADSPPVIGPAVPEALAEPLQTVRKKIAAHPYPRRLRAEGTVNNLLTINAAAGLPTRNFRSGVFEKVEEVGGKAVADDLWDGGRRRRPCWRCPLACSHLGVVRSGPWAGLVDSGPEYESLWAMGPQCGVADRGAIAAADWLAEAYGLDTISLGNTIGFLMEASEQGLLKLPPGLEPEGGLRFGNARAVVEMVGRAGRMEDDLGRLVAGGVRRAASELGGGAHAFAMHSKGLELPGYDPRAGYAQGLAMATSDRGACHIRPFAFEPVLGRDPSTTEGKGPWVADRRRAKAIVDSLGLCYFVAASLITTVDGDLFPVTRAVTGFDYDLEEFLRIGERVDNLTRAFNVREGFLRAEDSLPPRLIAEPAPEGAAKGRVVPLQAMLDDYYEYCGWDKEGRPKEETLRRLGLDFALPQAPNA